MILALPWCFTVDDRRSNPTIRSATTDKLRFPDHFLFLDGIRDRMTLDNSCQPTQNQFRKIPRRAAFAPASKKEKPDGTHDKNPWHNGGATESALVGCLRLPNSNEHTHPRPESLTHRGRRYGVGPGDPSSRPDAFCNPPSELHSHHSHHRPYLHTYPGSQRVAQRDGNANQRDARGGNR
jgi:hypothetical protein